MPDLNDFYAFKMTTSDSFPIRGKSNNSDNGSNEPNGCCTALIVLAVIGWMLWFVGRFLT